MRGLFEERASEKTIRLHTLRVCSEVLDFGKSEAEKLVELLWHHF
jgi:hypothetical protein